MKRDACSWRWWRLKKIKRKEMVSTAKQWKNWGIKRWTWLSNWPEHNLHFEGFLSNVISNPPLENLPFIGFGPTWPFFIRTNESFEYFVAFFATIKRCLCQMNESSSSRVLISMRSNWHRLTFKKMKYIYFKNLLPWQHFARYKRRHFN